MITWAQLLTDIRNDLRDTTDKPRWSNEVLYVYAKDAIRDYSRHFPRVEREAIARVDGAYPLPELFVNELYVESPKDNYLERRLERPGARFFSMPNQYWIEGNLLYISGEPEEIYLTYEATHGIPASVDDDNFAITIPAADEELVRLYIKAKALELFRSQQANLDRFKMGSGSRDDNPLQPEVADLMDEYRQKVAERTLGGTILLYRTGRRR